MTEPDTNTRWLTAADSIDAEAALHYLPEPDMLMGYPTAEGQGVTTPSGTLYGWAPEDFTEARTRGLHIARICNRYPTSACSIADVESGALTFTDAQTYVLAREEIYPGTSTVYASLDNWPAVGRACRVKRPTWAWVAFWPAYPTAQEVRDIETELNQVCPGTKLAGIQYRNLSASNVDLSVIVAPEWATLP